MKLPNGIPVPEKHRANIKAQVDAGDFPPTPDGYEELQWGLDCMAMADAWEPPKAKAVKKKNKVGGRYPSIESRMAEPCDGLGIPHTWGATLDKMIGGLDHPPENITCPCKKQHNWFSQFQFVDHRLDGCLVVDWEESPVADLWDQDKLPGDQGHRLIPVRDKKGAVLRAALASKNPRVLLSAKEDDLFGHLFAYLRRRGCGGCSVVQPYHLTDATSARKFDEDRDEYKWVVKDDFVIFELPNKLKDAHEERLREWVSMRLAKGKLTWLWTKPGKNAEFMQTLATRWGGRKTPLIKL